MILISGLCWPLRWVLLLLADMLTAWPSLTRVLIDWDYGASGIWWCSTKEEHEAPAPQGGYWTGTPQPGREERPRAWSDRLSEGLLDDLQAWNDAWDSVGPGTTGRSPGGRCRSAAVSWRSGFRMSWGRTAGKCSTGRTAEYTGSMGRATGRPERGTRSFSATRRETGDLPERPGSARRFLIGRSGQT